MNIFAGIGCRPDNFFFKRLSKKLARNGIFLEVFRWSHSSSTFVVSSGYPNYHIYLQGSKEQVRKYLESQQRLLQK